MPPAIARQLGAMACLLALGCGGGGGEATDQPGAASFRRQRGPRLIENKELPAAEPAPSAVENRPTAPAPPPPAAPAPEAAAEEKPERNLGAELSAAVGNVTTCLKPRPVGGGGPTTLSVSLEAVLTQTGIVTRSSARGSGLDAGETECVRRRLDGARLTGPIEDAPRTVSTTITVTLTAPPPAKPSDATPPAPTAAPAATGSP